MLVCDFSLKAACKLTKKWHGTSQVINMRRMSIFLIIEPIRICVHCKSICYITTALNSWLANENLFSTKMSDWLLCFF